MATASLVLSIVALVVASISVIYTKRQADAMYEVAGIEGDRRREEVERQEAANRYATHAHVAATLKGSRGAGAIDPDGTRSHGVEVVLTNIGDAPARKVYANIDTFTGNGPSWDHAGTELVELSSKQEHRSPLVVSDSTPTSFNVVVSWMDAREERQTATWPLYLK